MSKTLPGAALLCCCVVLGCGGPEASDRPPRQQNDGEAQAMGFPQGPYLIRVGAEQAVMTVTGHTIEQEYREWAHLKLPVSLVNSGVDTLQVEACGDRTHLGVSWELFVDTAWVAGHSLLAGARTLELCPDIEIPNPVPPGASYQGFISLGFDLTALSANVQRRGLPARLRFTLQLRGPAGLVPGEEARTETVLVLEAS